jgi:hypothetical protein
MFGFAASFKPFPALVVVVLLVERRFRLAIAAAATYLAFCALATWRFGFACWGQFAAGQKPVMDYWMSSIQNASLHGIVLRWFHPVCGPRGPQELAATVIASLLSLGLIVAFWWLGRPLIRAGKLDLPIASLLALAPFVNPVMWEHYDVLLLLPLMIAAVALWRAEGLSPGKMILGWAAVVAVALLLGQDINVKGRFVDAAARNLSVHVKLHLYEIANWLASPILLALLAALERFYARRPEAEPCPR